MSYTYAVLELSPQAYKEISDKLREAGYSHAVQKGPGGEVIDMSGIAVKEADHSASVPAPKPYRPPHARRDSLSSKRDFPNPTPGRKLIPAVQETDVSRAANLRPLAETRAKEAEPRTVFRTEPGPGVRIAVKNDDGHILAIDNGDGEGLNLLGGPVAEGETPQEAAARILENQVGLEATDLISVHHGPRDKYGDSSAFVVLADNGLEVNAEGEAEAHFVRIDDVLRGAWGLFARDALNAAGWMNRPTLDLEKLYEVCRRADRDSRATVGTDMVMNEVIFLQQIGKIDEIDAILEEVDPVKLHPDVADALLVIVEPIEGLRNKEAFEKHVEILLEAVDGPRTKIRFGGHSDVRAAARKYYRKKAAEFGQMLRDGTLAEKFPGRHRGGGATRKDISDGATFEDVASSQSPGRSWKN